MKKLSSNSIYNIISSWRPQNICRHFPSYHCDQISWCLLSKFDLRSSAISGLCPCSHTPLSPISCQMVHWTHNFMTNKRKKQATNQISKQQQQQHKANKILAALKFQIPFNDTQFRVYCLETFALSRSMDSNSCVTNQFKVKFVWNNQYNDGKKTHF